MNSPENIPASGYENKPFTVVGRMVDEGGNSTGYDTAAGFDNWADAQRFLRDAKKENPGVVVWELLDADGKPMDIPSNEKELN